MRPFRTEGKDQFQVARMICEQEPDPPSATRARNQDAAPLDPRRLKGDLDKIVLMAIRKEPARRYASVGHLSADVQAYLDGYPVRARTDAWGYRSGKFIRRHKLGVAATALAAAGADRRQHRDGVAGQARDARAEQSHSARRSSWRLCSRPLRLTWRVGVPLRRAILLDQGAQRLDRDLAGEPEVRAAMSDNIASAYRNIGMADRALPVAENAFQLNVQTHGANSAEAASSLELLATLYRDEGQYAEGRAAISPVSGDAP